MSTVIVDDVKVHINPGYWKWGATLDNYDGGEGAGFQPVGYGDTEQAALDDLFDQIEEHEALMEIRRGAR